MSKRALPRLSNQVLDEAARWFVELNEGARDKVSRESFNRWLKASPEHVRAYLQIAAHWEEGTPHAGAAVESIDELIDIGRADANVVPLVDLSLQTPERAGQAAPGLRSSRRLIARHPYALAACLLLMIAIAGAWLNFQRGVYATDIGEQRSLRLADGSTVELNALTRIKVSYSGHERHIDLIKGQALFEVAKDRSRPFIVRTGNTQVRAVGTRFDVYRKKSGTIVTVIEGRVAVLAGEATGGAPETPLPRPKTGQQVDDVADQTRSGESGGIRATDREILIAAGEQIKVTSAADAVPRRANVVAATAWTQRRLVFNRAPLSEVVEEFNRYNPMPLVITDPALGAIPISGAFSSSDPAALLRFLSEVGQYDIRRTNDAIQISRSETTRN